MRNRRRGFDVFSLSFLDVICCGFGAIVLLLVLTKIGEPRAIEEARRDLDGRIDRTRGRTLRDPGRRPRSSSAG